MPSCAKLSQPVPAVPYHAMLCCATLSCAMPIPDEKCCTVPSCAKPCSAELSSCLGLNPALEGAVAWGHGDTGTGRGAQGQGHRDTAQGDRHGDTEGDTAMGTQGYGSGDMGTQLWGHRGTWLWGWEKGRGPTRGREQPAGSCGAGVPLGWGCGARGLGGTQGRGAGTQACGAALRCPCPCGALSLWVWGLRCAPPRAFLEGMSGTRTWGSGASVSGAGGLWGGMPGRAQPLQGHQSAAFCPRNGIGLPWGHGGVPMPGSWAQSPAPQLALAGRTHLIKSCPLGRFWGCERSGDRGRSAAGPGSPR